MKHPIAPLRRRLAVAVVGFVVVAGMLLLPSVSGAQPDLANGAAADGDNRLAAVDVERFGGADRFATSLLVAEAFAELNGGSVEDIVVVSGTRWTDAVVAAPLAAMACAPVLLTPADGVRDDLAAFIADAGVTNATIISAEQADRGPGVGTAVDAAFGAAGVRVTRVGGVDQYFASVEVARRLGSPGELGGFGATAIVASGEVFADALVAGPLAAQRRLPILLTPPDGLHADVAAYLSEAGINHVVLMGGTAALSAAVEAGITERGITVDRMSGATRFETATALGSYAADHVEGCFDGAGVGLARADVPFDAFSAAPLLSEGCAPLVLSGPDVIPDTTAAFLDSIRHDDSVTFTVFGGDAAIASDAIDLYLEPASRVVLSAVPGEATVIPYRGQVSVSWPPVEALEGSPVAGYEFQWRPRGESWDQVRRAVVVGQSYEVGGLRGGVHEVRVRPAVVERAEAAGASIVSAQGSGPTASLVASPVGVDEASNVSAFDGAVNFEMTGEPVWPATIEIPVDMAKAQDDDFIFLMSFNEEFQVWLPEPGAVFDPDRGVVTAEVHHLSNWFVKGLGAIGSEIREGAALAGAEISEVGRGVLDTLDTVGEVITEPLINAAQESVEGTKAVTKYVWDKYGAGVVYVVEKGRIFLVNTYAATREAALVAARATWEATKLAAAMGWDAVVELAEAWVDRLTFDPPSCGDMDPLWVSSVEVPGLGAPLIVCSEAVGSHSEQDLRLKVASQRYYPMLLTARDAASSQKIKISPADDDPGRVRVERTEGYSTLADVMVAWLDAAFDAGQPVLPASATHWLRIPRSALEDPPSMTLEGRYDGSAANLNTVFMGVDLLADIYGIPIGSGDISQLHDLSNDAAECFSLSYTTASTEPERWRSFNETTACLQPIYLKALSSKTIKTLLGPATFLLEATVQLAGYVEAARDIATGQDAPTTTIDAAPGDDNTQPDNRTPRPSPDTLETVTAGEIHSCGLRSGNTITCWGDNRWGQLDAPSGSFQAVTPGLTESPRVSWRLCSLRGWSNARKSEISRRAGLSEFLCNRP